MKRMTKKLRAACIVCAVFVLAVGIYWFNSSSCYTTTDYQLKVPNSFQISPVDDGLVISKDTVTVGGITLYAEDLSYDALMDLLQDGEQWVSYSLESNKTADKQLTYEDAAGEWHHYLFRVRNKGIYDLWFCTENITAKTESWIVEHFQLK